MAKPTTQRFGSSIFYIEDPDNTGTYVKVVGMTSGEMTLDKAVGSTVVPDSDNPDAATWEEKDVTSMSWSMAFSGVSSLEAMPLIEKVSLLGTSVNVRLVEKGAGTGSGTPDKRSSGAAIIKFSKNWQRGERVSVKVDVEGDGALDIASVAAA